MHKTINQTDIRNGIVKERRLELCFEGHHWFYLMRTEKTYEVMKDIGMEPYMTVFSIPMSQIQLISDPAVLSQNPNNY